jgi:hypothetical protein
MFKGHIKFAVRGSKSNSRTPRGLPHFRHIIPTLLWTDFGVELPDFGRGFGLNGFVEVQDSAGGSVLHPKTFKSPHPDSLSQ